MSGLGSITERICSWVEPKSSSTVHRAFSNTLQTSEENDTLIAYTRIYQVHGSMVSVI